MSVDDDLNLTGLNAEQMTEAVHKLQHDKLPGLVNVNDILNEILLKVLQTTFIGLALRGCLKMTPKPLQQSYHTVTKHKNRIRKNTLLYFVLCGLL